MKQLAICLFWLSLGATSAFASDAGSERVLATAKTSKRQWKVELLGEKVARGKQTLELRLVGPKMRLSEIAELTVVPWMPTMGHGVEPGPQVESLGEGRFRLRDLDLFMPGLWELRIKWEGKSSDSVVIPLEVPR